MPIYVEDLLSNEPLKVTSRNVTRFIMEISDAAGLIVKSTEHIRGGEIFILKMKAFSLGDLVDVMVDRIAPNLGVDKNEVRIDTVGLGPCEKLHEDLVGFAEYSRLYEMDDMYVVLQDENSAQEYPSLKKVKLPNYTSEDVEPLSKDELEAIVVRYLEKSRTNPPDL